MGKRRRRYLLVAVGMLLAFSTAGFALPTFSDQDIAAGNLNPTDHVIVQQIQVAGDSSQAVTLTSVTVQNLGTAGSGQITKVEIWDGGTKLGESTNMVGLPSGVTINLGGYTVPSGTTHMLKIYVTVGTAVTGGETVLLRAKVYYQMGSSSYATTWIADGTGETIRDGGFDELSDGSPAATYFDPGDSDTVQVSVFTDSDANANNVFWTQTGSAPDKILTVENLGTATTDDIAQVKVTLTIGGTDYTTGFVAWAPASPMPFAFDEFTPALPAFVPNNSSMTVKVEMTMKGSANVTDGRTIRTRVTVYVTEGGEPYDQQITSNTTQTIRNQGFETISEESTPPTSGVAETGGALVQTVKVTDDDVNTFGVTINGIYIRNTGTATGAEIHQITVRAGSTTLATITGATLSNLQAGITVAPTGTTKAVADDGSQTITLSYEIATPVAGHTLRPAVKVRGQENGTNYWSGEVTFPSSVTLYGPGFETVENVSPPSGGTAYSGQRFLAQKIHLVDLDENDDDVTINPVVVTNLGSAEAGTDVAKIEVYRKDGPTAAEQLLGETTDLTGLRSGGVTIPTLQNNVVVDKAQGSSTDLLIYVTLGDPEDVTAGHTLTLKTDVLHTEGGASYDKSATGSTWTLAINHRPTVDFTYTPASPTYEDTITFTANVTDPDSDTIASYSWDFGDGDTSTQQNPTHQYPDGGTFDVTLTATDSRGTPGTKTKTITVEGPPNEAPTADFSWDPAAPSTGETVTFTDESTDPDGTIASWAWDFGDGTTSTSQNPTHAFADKQSYTITLTVTDDEGAEDTVTKTLAVGNEPPVADFTYAPASPTVGQTVTFTDASTDADGTVEAWAWDFDDGTTSTVENPTHAFTVAGTYTVSLIVTDDKGTDSTAKTEDITVSGPTQTEVHAYPNPATTQATIVYYLPAGASAPILRIYNVAGALVRQETLPAGSSTYVWDLTSDAGDDVPNGLYFCVVTATGAPRPTTFKILITR